MSPPHRNPQASAYSYREDPTVPAFPDNHPIIVFDGVCVLCSGSVQFVLNRDKALKFRFVTAQSSIGEALYRHYNLASDQAAYESAILLSDGHWWIKSDAAIRILAGLGWPWRTAVCLKVVPIFIRDWIYDRIARNRYRLFGKRDICMVPVGSDKSRFIE